ncbi:hypothetical protein J4456_04040 [Candidatus Pacearchaeota archaeon]|nr:hypothetical protein [Candidatus Pacearchaeota archaeon]
MNKAIGYLLAGVGLIGMGLTSAFGQRLVPALSVVPKNFILIPSLILTGVGIVIMIITSKGGSGKIQQAAKEVPIYQGEGKKRKIVGYRVEEK